MRMYLTGNGTYFATQDEARKAAKSFGCTFEPVDVPTKLRELAGYLNAVAAPVAFPERSVPAPAPVSAPTHNPTAHSVAIDDNWEALPLARKLHFAALAMEAARDAIPNTDPPTPQRTVKPVAVFEDD